MRKFNLLFKRGLSAFVLLLFMTVGANAVMAQSNDFTTLGETVDHNITSTVEEISSYAKDKLEDLIQNPGQYPETEYNVRKHLYTELASGGKTYTNGDALFASSVSSARMYNDSSFKTPVAMRPIVMEVYNDIQ